MAASLATLYRRTVIERPVLALAVLAGLAVWLLSYSTNLKLDASSESIVLENDEDLRYYRETLETYGSDDFVVITYTPAGDLMAPESLDALQRLRDDLAAVPRVESVLTMLDVPLLNSPKVSIDQLTDGQAVNTLETPGVDTTLARREFVESPIYRSNLVSQDGRTTAIRVVFEQDAQYHAWQTRRNQLREQRDASGLSEDERNELARVSRQFADYHNHVVERQRVDVEQIRSVMANYRDRAQLYLGGVRMITTDMISFIEHDIIVFGLGVAGFLIAALSVFFRSVRWVLIPMSSCLLSVSVMVGLLGWLDWRITVISSNFTSLLLIVTMSLTIHLIVRYRIVCEQQPTADQASLVFDTMRIMALPSFFTATTTIVAFCSLVVSGIRPVIDFGWMMTIGIAVAFALTFVYFPSVLALLPREQVSPGRDITKQFTLGIAAFTLRHAAVIVFGCAGLAVLGVMGIAQLEVENRFIDHFKSSTEIYQGMELIDSQLGGTIPLDIVIDADASVLAAMQGEAEEDAFDDPFADPFAEDGDTEDLTYWFNNDQLAVVEQIHDYADGLPEVGKVLSIATGIKVFRHLNDQQMPEDYELALLRKWAPENVKDALIRPYLSEDGNQVRLTMRLIESAPSLKRKELIHRIRSHLVDDMHLPAQTVHMTGMAVLYNNLLQSLYTSQILTLGVVFVSILVMFLLFFRHLTISLLAILPNLLAAGIVLGLMGWTGIPLDMMTITIAAIAIGIGVDDTIHYVHRFQVEFTKYGTYRDTVRACHGSIGTAMYYTSLVITAGFSILALSSFIPTIYFGILTGVAMLAALMSNLTLLAALFMIVRPLGPEHPQAAPSGPESASG